MRVGLAGAWTVPDDACDGLNAPRRVLGAVPGPASLPETASSTSRKIKLIGTDAVLKQRCWHACGFGGGLLRVARVFYVQSRRDIVLNRRFLLQSSN